VSVDKNKQKIYSEILLGDNQGMNCDLNLFAHY